MIIVSYITENFIRETLRLNGEKLRLFLEGLCKMNENIFFIFEPGFNFSFIRENPPANIIQNNISLWSRYLSFLIKIGRLKSNEFIKGFFDKKNNNSTEKSNFIKKALSNKVYYLSFENFEINNHFFDMESLGGNVEEIRYKIDALLRDYAKPVKNIKKLKDREKLFFDKLGGFCCFYNTFIWLDRYILDPRKDPINYLNTIARLLNGSSIKHLIIITRDPYAENKKYDKYKNSYKTKKECIKDYLDMIYQAIYPNEVFVQLFVVVPEELQKIHSRYASWANLHDHNEVDHSSLDCLSNQIKVTVQPDKGAGYFEDETNYGFSAQFNFASADVVNDYIQDLIQSKPLLEYSSYEYWLEENYPMDKVWIHHSDILKKEGLNQTLL